MCAYSNFFVQIWPRYWDLLNFSTNMMHGLGNLEAFLWTVQTEIVHRVKTFNFFIQHLPLSFLKMFYDQLKVLQQYLCVQ